jgi:DNA-binding NarL/FixJ family response regulator
MERGTAMNKNKPMPLLLIEDDMAECRKFKNCADARTDVIFVGMTGSSDEGLQLVKDCLPEGVILDLELSKGKGDGLQFLSDLKEAKLGLRPIVVVTTNIQSEIMHDILHNDEVSFVFCKRQTGYNPERVINIILSLRQSLPSAQRGEMYSDLQTIESPDEFRSRLNTRIDNELSQVGISNRLKGRKYLHEALFLLIKKEKNESDAVLYQVADNNKVKYNSVLRAIQTAIQNAWKHSDVDTLTKKYPMYVDIHMGVPAPTEFISCFAKRIRNTM